MGGTVLGLYLDNPETTQPENLRSYAAMDITNDKVTTEWPKDWVTIPVGGGPAAVLTVQGSYSQLAQAWQSFGGRVTQQGWKCSNDPQHVSQEIYVSMDPKDDSKNVTKLVMFLEE